MARREHCETGHECDLGRGVVNGLLIAIPLWVIIVIVPVLLFRDGPMGETISAALMIAAVCETILALPYARMLLASARQALPAPRVPGARGGLHAELEKHAGRGFHSIEDLLRYVEPKFAPRQKARRAVASPSLFRQSLALSALAGGYLQYYFIEVNLQIASLHSLTVFLPVTSMT